MKRVRCLAGLWIVVFIQTGFGVCGTTVFVDREEGQSVLLSCATEPGSPSPFGFYLKRGWLQPGEVLFQYKKADFSAKNSAYEGRLAVSGDPSTRSVNVTVSQLRAADTDRYFCEFVVDKPGSEDQRVPGQTEFFLLVNPAATLASGDRCGCQHHDTLLYGLSGAVGLLLVLLLGSIVKLKVAARRRGNSQPQPPIYEEMVGVPSPSHKLATLRFEEVEYKNGTGRKTTPENHYESPSGALSPRIESQN